MNQCIPRKSVPIKSPTPWIDREIRSDIGKHERLFRKAKRSHSEDYSIRFKRLRNSIVTKICIA